MEHVVLFKYKPDTPGPLKDALTRKIIKLKELPMVDDITIGLNRTDRGKGYTHCLVARLSVADPDNAPLAELDAYQKHPLHLEAVKIMKEIAAGVLAVDYLSPRHTSATRGWSKLGCLVLGIGIGCAAAFALKK